MALWEYKVITSGKGGFATPALLEKFLNDLGRDEWEIVDFQTLPDNFLAFTGLARRPTQRDWTLQDAATAAAKVEAEKLRAEFEAKFKAAAVPATGPEENAPSFIDEKLAPDDGFRKPFDTSHDADPEPDEEESKVDEWDKLTAAEEDQLPTFFDAIKPHMRRNQRGPGMSVGVDYLAKKWDQTEDDLKGALAECGFVVPADEDAKTEYLEYDGDLYWLNVNRRGELWINTKEKPRPVFRSVKAVRIADEAGGAREEGRGSGEPKPATAEKPENGNQKPAFAEGTAGKPESSEPATESPAPAQSGVRQPPSAVASAALPVGPALLDRIRPHMRRNRRGPGGSGSASFLSRALKTREPDLKTAFVSLGLVVPATPGDRPVFVEIGPELWWLNLDSRGGLWINGREKAAGETVESAQAGEPEAMPAAAAPEGGPAPEGAPAATASADAPPAVPVPPSPTVGGTTLAGVRLLLKETKTGAVAAKVDHLAEALGKSSDEVVATLVAAGLKVPEKPREKPIFVEHAGEIFWLNQNAKGELWVNAKASKFADKKEGDGGSSEADGGKKPGRRGGGHSRKKGE